jgi:hypothetical protein
LEEIDESFEKDAHYCRLEVDLRTYKSVITHGGGLANGIEYVV